MTLAPSDPAVRAIGDVIVRLTEEGDRWRERTRSAELRGRTTRALERSRLVDALRCVVRKLRRGEKAQARRSRRRVNLAARVCAALPCPRCDAARGERCRDARGPLAAYTHPARWVPYAQACEVERVSAHRS